MFRTIKSLLFAVLIGLLASSCVTTPYKDAAQPTLDELLTGMPAQSFDDFNAFGASCVDLGDDAVEELCAMLVPPGTGDDTVARFALNGLVKYVSRPGAERERRMVVKEIVEVLSEVKDDEIAAFLMRQLEVAGENESVATLASFLADDRLGEPAILALTTIGTRKAARALYKALPESTGMNRIMIIKALGTLDYGRAEKKIAAFAESEDADLSKVAQYALSVLAQ